MLQNNFKNLLKNLRSKLLQIGSSKKCPVCEKSFLFFLPGGQDSKIFKELNVVGAGYRKNVVCPECFSIDRSRLLFLFITRFIDIKSNKFKSILHVSPQYEFEEYMQALEGKEYISIDIMPKQAMLKMDLRNLDFHSDHFDLIICNHVIEQIDDEQSCIDEMKRVLKGNGIIIMQAPIALNLPKTFESEIALDNDSREKLYGQHDMLRIYGRDYAERIKLMGLNSKIISQEDFLDQEEQLTYGIDPRESVYIFYKNS